ncbi:ribosome small subunit-dependent GTPase A [Camelliibacillus cellulosilyticus]|uniref:Small ribosomal subunit biogenesis GTPase RsgA n=1 Tax=Camelliibacillus cellulosilyticus TaxID=2174486 RepID=A0ABV9GH35_9BACL
MAIGKIMKALSGFYYVKDGEDVFQCRARGNFRKKKLTPLVGDIVEFAAENPTDGYILSILTRDNALERPPIANVDQALLVFSARRPDFDTGLLDRFLVCIEAHRLDILICLTKMDLLDEEALASFADIVDVYREIGYPIFLVSALNAQGLAELSQHLKDKTTVFAGQSGVGKSSLLNALNPSLSLETNEISEALGRGKHTTRHVELLSVADGLVADTPGFSSLDFSGIEANDLAELFPEMAALAPDCKFRGCTHLAEPGCAVKQALLSGRIADFRYEHYRQFYDEIFTRKKRY